MKRKQKNIIIGISIFIILIGVLYASGLFKLNKTLVIAPVPDGVHCCASETNAYSTIDSCPNGYTMKFVDVFNKKICLGTFDGTNLYDICNGGAYSCTSLNGEYTPYYCNLDTIVSCPHHFSTILNHEIGGCNHISDNSKDDFCANATDPVPTPNCSEGYMQCGLGTTYNAQGNVYKCVDGDWQLQQTCTMGCTVDANTHAYCNFKKYYCLGTNAISQVNEGCFWSDTKMSNCFDTVTECTSQTPHCCENGNNYTLRLGSCLSGETPGFRYPFYDKTECESQNPLSCKLKNVSDCGDKCSNQQCTECGYYFVSKSLWYNPFSWGKGSCSSTKPIGVCKNCDSFAFNFIFGGFIKSTQCTPKTGSIVGIFIGISPPVMLWNAIFGTNPLKTTMDNLPQNTTFCILSFVKICLMPLIFIFVMLFGNELLQHFKSLKGKKKGKFRLILSLLIALILCYLIWIAFLIGVVLFIILIVGFVIIKFFI